MTHRWRYETSDGTAVDGPGLTFADQAEAEAWFGDNWESLAGDGVEQVVLLRADGSGDTEADTVVYGPMLLSP